MIILIGSLFSIAFTCIIALACNGVAFAFFDLPSLLLIIVPLIFFLWITGSGKVVGEYIKSSFKSNYQYTAAELNTIASVIKNIIKVTLASGILGFFSGLIVVLTNLGDPSLIGPSLSVSLITVYYAISISFFIFFPLQVWAENKSVT